MIPKISVIVPVFKVEEYLDRCVESILAQTYKNLEVWLVDDGSPDRCGQICDAWAKKDERIKVIHKPNGGLADARNVAIEVATGDYLCFIDSDDYISKCYVEFLYSMIEKFGVETSVVNFKTFHQGDVLEDEPTIDDAVRLDSVKALETMFYQGRFDTTAWGKMYHRRLFEDVRYPTDCVIEDCPTTYRLIDKSNGVAVSANQQYYYLLRDDSIEGAPFSEKKMDSAMKVFDYWECNKQIVCKVQRAYECRLISLAMHFLMKAPDGYHRIDEIMSIIKRYRFRVLTDSNARVKARIACLVSYFGMGVFRWCFKFADRRH